MFLNRHAARELAMKTLFQWDLVQGDWRAALHYLAGEDGVPEQVFAFAKLITEGVVNNHREIDDWIARYTRDWRFERLAAIDRAILRLSIYEILYLEQIPIRVSINEAVELAKAYGTEDSPKFINGLLGMLVREGIPEHILAKKDTR